MISPAYKGNFQQFTELLDYNKIPYCVMAGTLLGAIRNSDFIEHDEDIDIAINAKYKKDVKELMEKYCWHYYACWRMEFGVVRYNYTKAESKIDIFFYDSDEKHSYIYSYKKNPMHGRWDIEWRMKFPLGVFDNIKRWKIGDVPIFLPIRAEEILKAEYGPDWKISNSKWNTYKAPCYDTEYREIAIIIPTFIRDEKMQTLVKSIKQTFSADWYRIYIADQGCYTENKEIFYNNLRKEGHYCSFVPFNAGLSYCRNYLVDKVKEPFILVMDDDFEVSNKVDISNFITILNTDPNIGVVGGILDGHQEYHYDLFHDIDKNKLYYIRMNSHKKELTQKTVIQPRVEFLYKDIVLNFAMFRTEVFKDVKWDNNLKLCEHTDFFLQIKKLKKWRVAFTKEVIGNHQKTLNNNDYIEYRRTINNKSSADIFYKKWNFINDDISLIILKEE